MVLEVIMSVSYYMCMLLKKNVLLHLYEPSNSLDSVSEISVIQALSNITFKGNIIISSIHHPGGETFTIFDGLMLLSRLKHKVLHNFFRAAKDVWYCILLLS